MSVKWPSTWDPHAGWSLLTKGTRSTPALTSEPRSLETLHGALRKRGTSIRAVIQALGGPNGPCRDRTLEEVDTEIRSFWEKTGTRPTGKSHPHLAGWLRKYRNSSIPQRCDDLGVGVRPLVESRTLEDVDAELLAYWKKTAVRPTAASHSALEGWLRAHLKSTTHRRCRELGIPGGQTKHRTLEMADAELCAYWKEVGERPTSKSHHPLDAWLRTHHNSSVPLRCTVLNIPGGLAPTRTSQEVSARMQGIEAELLAYWKRTGTRPTAASHPKFDRWLRHNSNTSVNQRCGELGIPGSYNMDRTLEGVDAELLAHWEKTGARPTNRSHRGINSWLRAHGSSVAQRCDNMKGERLTFVPIEEQMATRLLLVYHARTGRWAHGGMKDIVEGDGRTWGTIDHGLRRVGSSLSTLKAQVVRMNP